MVGVHGGPLWPTAYYQHFYLKHPNFQEILKSQSLKIFTFKKKCHYFCTGVYTCKLITYSCNIIIYTCTLKYVYRKENQYIYTCKMIMHIWSHDIFSHTAKQFHAVEIIMPRREINTCFLIVWKHFAVHEKMWSSIHSYVPCIHTNIACIHTLHFVVQLFNLGQMFFRTSRKKKTSKETP